MTDSDSRAIGRLEGTVGALIQEVRTLTQAVEALKEHKWVSIGRSSVVSAMTTTAFLGLIQLWKSFKG